MKIEKMKKTIIVTKTLLFLLLTLGISTSCNQTPSAEKWLKSIFECPNGSSFCFPDQEKVFTKQYLEFYYESLEIYEYPDFETEEEQVAAEKAFENKWKNIYSLDAYIWPPFGMGNGIEVGYNLKNVTITPIAELEYTVIIDFGQETVFSNKVVLVRSGEAFLIDYIETDLIK
ncbi:MAG: hypothetical protein PHI36_04905 [Bacteroidales bacterium]|nr:hypothetical protein [Bacteroidales bacterium]